MSQPVFNDELFSDAFSIETVGAAYEVDCKMITIGVDEINTGANASAEDAAEQLEDSAQQVNDVVYSGRLQQTFFDKKSFVIYIKGYMKALAAKLKEENPERVPSFMKEAQELVGKVVANFKDYEFYTGESMNPDGMVALLNYRKDGVTPYFTFFKDGLKETKV
ncbi:hypothetical protein H4R24_001611 [Coemansia sp. RSA 988]|nr:hypothetical protein H4R24_001611 [Coemansia sp. RSA 988]